MNIPEDMKVLMSRTPLVWQTPDLPPNSEIMPSRADNLDTRRP